MAYLGRNSRVSVNKFSRRRAAAGVLAVAAVLVGLLVYGPSRVGLASGGPILETDHTGYVAGQQVTITGTGFVPFDNVTLQVTHGDGTAGAGMGHETSGVSPDQNGNFSATWAVAPTDTAGNDFVATAAGPASGEAAAAAFSRIALIQTDKYDYLPGELIIITGSGFLPGEEVTLEVDHVSGLEAGAGHVPFTATSDASGQITTTWFVEPDDSLGAVLALTAVGARSGRSALTFFTDTLVTVVDDDGADGKNEPGQKDLNQLSVDNGNLPVAEAI